MGHEFAACEFAAACRRTIVRSSPLTQMLRDQRHLRQCCPRNLSTCPIDATDLLNSDNAQRELHADCRNFPI
jgi:hypothetical protein